MKHKARKVAQVLRIANRIQSMTRTDPKEARRAARYFAFWVQIINGKPLFQSQRNSGTRITTQ